jgi:hypothetical protein
MKFEWRGSLAMISVCAQTTGGVSARLKAVMKNLP